MQSKYLGLLHRNVEIFFSVQNFISIQLNAKSSTKIQFFSNKNAILSGTGSFVMSSENFNEEKRKISKMCDSCAAKYLRSFGSVRIPLSQLEPQEQFVCKICSAQFKVRSLLTAHTLTHNDVGRKRSASLKVNIYKCKYCFVSFSISQALELHQLNNCQKIPIKERRKLNEDILQHVSKPPVPRYNLRSIDKSNLTTFR